MAQSQEAYGILVAGTAVCTGYAHAFQLLAQASGLEPVVVTGTASSGFTTGGHAWNQVLVDGQWLVVDATWDDADDAVLGRDYLLIDRLDSRLASRTADTGWVLDANAGMYGG
jgi:transglutaminase-like putative cysteine protease